MQTLYAFENLKKFLEDLGYEVEAKSRIRTFKKDFRKALNEKRIKFSSKGIMYLNDEGEYVHVYAHIENFSGALPKFHVITCNTITRFINQGQFSERYNISNQMNCKLTKIDSHELGKEFELEICENCLRVGGWELKNEMKGVKTTYDFYKKFNKEKKITTNAEGYTFDWIQIKEKQKKNKKFICQKCGIDLSERPHLLDVHHKDNLRANNRENNLDVLCVKCHSNIDKDHKQRFTSPIEQTRLWELEEYKKLL